MQRSNHFVLITRAAITAALFVSLHVVAAQPPRAYHLELEASPAAPFPFLAKFGKVDLHVYRGGVRAETLWLNAFSRNNDPNLTVLNPLGRMYVEMPVANIGPMVKKLGGSHDAISSAIPIATPVRGKVKGIDALRYRLVYGPEAWIDLWTIEAVPENAQLRRIVNEFVSAISPSTAAAARSIPGTPVYVELNFSHYKKLPLLRMKELKFDDDGEADALRVGMIYVKAPFADAILK